MTNRVAAAREALHDAIAPILPGRTSPYPPPSTLVGSPYIWVGDTDGFPSTIGDRTKVVIVTFPIWVSYDGADRAQVAGVDDIVARVIDATTTIPLAAYAGHRAQPQDPSSTRRLTRVAVDVTVTAATLCPPDPVTASAIPPVPVEV